MHFSNWLSLSHNRWSCWYSVLSPKCLLQKQIKCSCKCYILFASKKIFGFSCFKALILHFRVLLLSIQALLSNYLSHFFDLCAFQPHVLKPCSHVSKLCSYVFKPCSHIFKPHAWDAYVFELFFRLHSFGHHFFGSLHYLNLNFALPDFCLRNICLITLVIRGVLKQACLRIYKNNVSIMKLGYRTIKRR